ncbi:MAG: sensor signal transduction histidine kinase [Verrucomicrobia bacterium]|nr:sensor signal transduction histidine kinase [Verrucomicrobiota bacterium]
MIAFLALLAAVAAAGWWRARRRAQEDSLRQARVLSGLREKHTQAIEEHQHQLETLLDSMIEGLIVLDNHGRITLSNRAAEMLFGFSRQMVGGSLLEAVRHHEVAAVAARLGAEAAILDHEIRLEGPPLRVVQVNAVVLRDSAGTGTGSLLVFHDLTRLRELEGARQEFVANVSHELRTPLSLIKSAAETLLDGGKSDATALDRLLKIIDRHADRLTLLIDDLLLLAKLDSGRMELHPEPTALRVATQDVFDDLLRRAAAREVRLENAVPPGLIAQADPDRLRQALSNLVDNGIKYGRIGGVLKVSARALEDRRIEICVRDDGPGIPPEALERVFERFYRVDKARSREQGGTGLGLAIVKHAIQAHGGDVRVESEPGKGAAFYFTLPAAGFGDRSS